MDFPPFANSPRSLANNFRIDSRDDHEPFPLEHGAHHYAADPSRRFPFSWPERRAGGAGPMDVRSPI
jgi:hypothetical protein